VISPDPLIEHVPLQYDTKSKDDASGNTIKKIITQYDMHAVGEDGVGLLKFDFLGIKNLSILADAVERVKKIEGKDIDIENITIVENEILDDETIEDSELEKYKNVLNENGYKLKTGYKLIKEEYI
jgi:DNA polymerase-3 subunit alpha